ncbi:hypothetical protein J43TS9_31670 [Paenibacillus cineris]|nr:hypothetical protein J43TS9_31670 [Paenibacillus cineris]
MQNPQPYEVVDFIYVIDEGESNPCPDITPTFFPRIDDDQRDKLLGLALFNALSDLGLYWLK